MNGGIDVQRCDTVQQGGLGQVGIVLFQHRVKAHVGAGFHLVAHVDLAGRIFTDQDHGQAGLAAGSAQGGCALGDFAAQLLGESDSVDELGWHGGRA